MRDYADGAPQSGGVGSEGPLASVGRLREVGTKAELASGLTEARVSGGAASAEEETADDGTMPADSGWSGRGGGSGGAGSGRAAGRAPSACSVPDPARSHRPGRYRRSGGLTVARSADALRREALVDL